MGSILSYFNSPKDNLPVVQEEPVQFTPAPEPVGGEDANGVAQHPDMGQDDAPQHPDMGQDDAQHQDMGQDDSEEREDTSSGPIIQEEFEPSVVFEQSFLHEANAIREAIDQKHASIKSICTDIDNLNAGFRQGLGVGEGALLSECFKHLRELIGPYETVHVEKENGIVMCIEIGEDADDGAKEALAKYNFMLRKCKEFQEESSEAKDFIQKKIMALESESVQIQATLEATERAKQQFDSLHAWDERIGKILTATKSALVHLTRPPRVTTGMIRVLKE